MGVSHSRQEFVYFSSLKSVKIVRRKRTCFLLIDPQNDFVLPTGSLSVPNAVDDCERIRQAMLENVLNIDAIFVTLDTHQKHHIAHAVFWRNSKGECPAPFTLISSSDIERGVWFTKEKKYQEWAETYVKQLEKGGRFQLTIWPEHCLVGSEGHAVYKPLFDAINVWEEQTGFPADFTLKGNNEFTEHYSAIRAEVPMKEDKNTFINTYLLKVLTSYDRIVIAGQALSHCVNFTVRDIVANVSRETANKIFVLSDGCSSVRGFEAAGEKFVNDMKAKNIRFIKAADAFV